MKIILNTMKKITTLLVATVLLNSASAQAAQAPKPDLANALSAVVAEFKSPEMQKSLKNLSGELKGAIWNVGLSVTELLKMQELSKKNKALFDKLPTIIVAIVIDFADAVVEMLKQANNDDESLSIDYEAMKGQILSSAGSLLNDKAMAISKNCAAKPSASKCDDSKINLLFNSCQAEIFTPLLILLVVNSLREQTSLVNENANILSSEILTPKFHESAKNVLKTHLEPQEVDTLTTFFNSSCYKKLRANWNYFANIVTKYIPKKIASTVSSVKDWVAKNLSAAEPTATPAA